MFWRIICFLNADDLFAHNKVLELIERSIPGIDVVIGDISFPNKPTWSSNSLLESCPIQRLFSKGWHAPHPAFSLASAL